MKTIRKESLFDIGEFYKKEMITTRIIVDSIRSEMLPFSKAQYSSFRMQKTYPNSPKEKLTKKD